MAEEFKVLLGVDVDIEGARAEIKKLEAEAVRIPVKFDGLEDEIKRLGREFSRSVSGKQSLPIGFDQKQINQITNAFSRLEKSIGGIQKAFGTLDDSVNMKPMLASINSISDALSDTKAEFQSLSKAISDMQFNVNLNFGAGGNPATRASKSASMMREQVVLEIIQQAKELERLLGGQGRAWTLYGLSSFDDLNKLVATMGGDHMRRAADAGKKYIGILKELAVANNVKLDSFNTQFTKTPEQLIDAVDKYSSGAEDIEKNINRFRDMFGGAQQQVNLDGTAISNQLIEIVQKLGKVEEALTRISVGGNLNDLTAAFNNVSGALRQIVTDCNLVRTAMQNMAGGQQGRTASSLHEIQRTAEAASQNLLHLQATLKGQGLDDSSIQRVTDDLTDMNLQITKITTNTVDDQKFSVSVEGIDQYNNKLVDTITYTQKLNKTTKQMEWVASHKQTTTSNYGVTTKDISEAEQNYQRMKDLITRRNKLLKQKAKSDSETPELDRQLQDNLTEYQTLYQQHYNGLTAQQRRYLNQRQQLNDDEKKIVDEAVANAKKLQQAREDQTKSEKADNAYQGVAKDLESDRYRIEKSLGGIREQMQDTTKAYTAYTSALQAMQTVDATTSTADKIARTEAYEKALRDVELQIRKNIDAEKVDQKSVRLDLNKQAFSSSIDVWAKKNSKAAEHFKDELEAIRVKLKDCDATEFANLKVEFTDLKRRAEAAGLTVKSFGDELKGQFEKLTAFFTLDFVVDRATDAIRDMYQQVVEIDTAMTDLLKVTDETAARYEKFMSSASGSAKDLGRSMSSYITQTAEWSKMGYSLDEAEQLSKISSIYSNVGDVDDATAVSDMVTAMKAYGIEASNAIKIVDSLNKISNEFAVTAAGLGNGMANSASAMATSNTTFEQTMALLTGIAEITQSPAEAGSFLKVASMRIRGMKGALEELGEEVDENVDSISKVQTQILNLTKGRVNIFDGSGEFRNYYEIMQEIANIYDSLSSTDQSALTEILFGKMRGNQGAAMIQAFQSGQIQKALDAALGSAGSAMAEQEKWMESLEAKIGQIEAAWQSLSETILSSDFLKGLLDTAIGFLDILEKILDTAGVLPTILTGITAALSFNNVGELSKQFHYAITLANEYAHEAA